eukprot:scaffold64169_cov51-Attheya_sp.AAC.1
MPCLPAEKSKRGNTAAQVYGTSFGWSRGYGMKSKDSWGLSEEVPGNELLCETTRAVYAMGKCSRRNHSRVEERLWMKDGQDKSPKVLWDDCLEYEAVLCSHTALDIYGLQGKVSETVVVTDDKQKLARWLEPSFEVGSALCAKLLKANGEYAFWTTYRGLTMDEMNNPDRMKEMEKFDEVIVEKLGELADTKDFTEELDIETPIYEPYDDDEGGDMELFPDRDDDDPEIFDNYVGSEVLLQHGESMSSRKFIGRKRDKDGIAKGKANTNPILDTRTYQVRFPDGVEAEYAANAMAENMWAQCDPDGNQHVLPEAIIDHTKDSHAVKKADQMVVVNGRSSMKKTMKGWMLCMQWKDGTRTWEECLSELKESNPEPAFEWWVPFTLKKRDRIISAVSNHRYHKRTHKFGIELPRLVVVDARCLDKEIGNTLWLWDDAIKKEMKAVQVAFKKLDDGERAPPTYKISKYDVT